MNSTGKHSTDKQRNGLDKWAVICELGKVSMLSADAGIQILTFILTCNTGNSGRNRAKQQSLPPQCFVIQGKESASPACRAACARAPWE
eukprot:1156458-Pelagomonas_calceolata.AAC.12